MMFDKLVDAVLRHNPGRLRAEAKLQRRDQAGSPRLHPQLVAARHMTMSDDDAEWAARPCLREWTLRDRPCPWFTCGRDCEDTWADEAGAAFAAIRVAALAVRDDAHVC